MDSPDNKEQKSAGDWQPCPRGTILAPKLFQEQRVAGRRSALFQLILVYGCGGLVVFAILFSFLSDTNRLNRSARPLPKQLSCTAVRERMVAYSKNEVVCCSERAAIAQHLSNCAECDKQYLRLLERANGESTVQDKKP